jgi:hypothetical protein
MVNPASNTGYYGTPYPFGVDPVWQLAENRFYAFAILPFCQFTIKQFTILSIHHFAYSTLCITKHENFEGGKHCCK